MIEEGSSPVENVQAWIEGEIIGKGLCPPLARASRSYRDTKGAIDWNKFSKEVSIEETMDFEPGSPELLIYATSMYLDYVLDTVFKPDAPLSKIVVCPDFKSNEQFNTFLDQVKTGASIVLEAKQNLPIKTEILKQVWAARDSSADMIMQVLQGGPAGATSYIINNAFNPLGFYGQKIDDGNIANMQEDRGPLARERILHRAPHFLFQVINELRGRSLASTDPSRTYARNTNYALGLDPNRHEDIIRSYREGPTRI